MVTLHRGFPNPHVGPFVGLRPRLRRHHQPLHCPRRHPWHVDTRVLHNGGAVGDRLLLLVFEDLLRIQNVLKNAIMIPRFLGVRLGFRLVLDLLNGPDRNQNEWGLAGTQFDSWLHSRMRGRTPPESACCFLFPLFPLRWTRKSGRRFFFGIFFWQNVCSADYDSYEIATS